MPSVRRAFPFTVDTLDSKNPYALSNVQLSDSNNPQMRPDLPTDELMNLVE